MIKILSSKQTRALDAYTIEHEPVASIDLMERACLAFVEEFAGRFAPGKKVGIVCGTGNNGGDGLGIARLLHERGYSITVWVVRAGTQESGDFQKNFRRLQALRGASMFDIVSESDQGLFSSCEVLIDAIFGSGLSRPVSGLHAQAIRCINASKAVKVAVDVPSGLMADSVSSGEIVKADITISFQLPKLGFLLPQNADYVGDWTIVDIGLSKDFIASTKTNHYVITLDDIRKIITPRKKFAHKGTYGHALLIAGSYGKMGASILAARAALRSGVGLLTAYIPSDAVNVVQTAVPEAMVIPDPHPTHFTQDPAVEKFQSVGIGPGLGTQAETVSALQQLLAKSKAPLVLDADALNILSSHTELQQYVPSGSILTPHPKEFERFTGPWKNDFERLAKQKELAKRLDCIVVLKGANTSIATPEGDIYFNSTGNPGMATGGSGDVLTGVITALLAQGHRPADAAIAGVFLHGLAGDLAAREKGMHSLIASDLVEFLPKAFMAMR